MVDEFLESQNIKKPSILTNLGAQTEIVLK